MKPNHETIYLVPTDYDGGQLTYSWCDCPAPGQGMDPEDAIKYVRADLVPASNEVLANRIAELTNERDAALAASRHTADVAQQAISEIEALKVQIEKLKSRLAYFADILESDLLPCLEVDDGCSEDIASARELINKTPAQCLAEIKAQAVEPIFNKLKAAHGETTHPRAKVYLCEEAFELAEEVMQLRQQAKGEL